MKGRIPKDPAIRQRRNRTPGAATLPAKTSRRRVPPLPPHPVLLPEKLWPKDEETGLPVPTHKEWHSLTIAWWNDIWRSPMAPEYLKADIHGLIELAELVDRYWEEPSSSLAAEIRLQRTCFGLTPLDRRRLQWEVEKVESVVGKKKRARPQGIKAGEDPRDLFRAVK